MPIPSADNLKGCKGKASSSIPSSGVYVLTTFGGPSESQSLSCGGSSKSGSWYYAASRQRYGCGARIRIMANGKCVVAQTDDYGPDVCVENAAGMPVMDVSPLVGKALFGEAGLGWSDKKKVTVELAVDGTPLGPCTGKGDAPGGEGSGGSNGGGGSGGSSGGGSGGSSGGGVGGSSGGGSGGSSGGGSGGSSGGLGCTPSLCGTGTAATDLSGKPCYCDSACAGYGDCCSNQASVCGSSGSGGSGSGGSGSGGSGSGGSGSGGSSGGGQSCASDGACNPGNDGSGLICVGGTCVPGCKINAHCPGNTMCKGGQCV